MIQQGTPEWFRQRIGYFTSSEVGKLLGSGRSKDQVFSETALSYIRSIAAERDIAPEFLSLEIDPFTGQSPFDVYCARVERNSKSMQWGRDLEAFARAAYAVATGYDVEEVGFIACNDYFGDSADGVCKDRGSMEVIGTIEVKCPDPATHILYRQITDGAALFKQNRDYYAQCQGHCIAHGVQWCDFVSYDVMSSNPLHIVRIMRDEAFIEELTARLELADQYANALLRAS